MFNGTTTVKYVYEKEQEPVVKQSNLANHEKSVLLPKTSVNQKNQDNTPLISVLAILLGIMGLNFFKNKKKNK